MTLNQYPAQFEEAVNKNHTVVLLAKCEVWYSGRAESYLPVGDRAIIIKEDNTIIIHQPIGNNPVNYMKPGTRITMNYDEGKLFLNCRNLSMKEFMDIRIDKIFSFDSNKMVDGQSLQIEGTEKDMSDMLYAKPEIIEEGFRPYSREEHTKYGFLDLFGQDKEGKVVIVECKRYRADLPAVSQLRRYVEKIESSKGITDVRGIIAAPKISENALQMLQDWGFEFVSVNPPKYREKFDKDQRTLGHFG